MQSPQPRPELFADLATHFENGAVELPPQWLKEKRVSGEELQALEQHVALILRGYFAMHPSDQMAFVSRGVFLRRK